jgi:NADH-quinone oxidoreductase chain I
MSRYFSSLFTGAKSLLIGMKVTIREMFKPIVTVQYPREKCAITPNFRGHTMLVRDGETGTHRCISCKFCQMDCPSGCITVISEKREGVKGLTLLSYRLDFTKCSLCGICVEVCPTSALDFSAEYELAGFESSEFRYDLLRFMEERG